MTEQINDQISAFIDDELPDQESAFLLRRFERDSEAHGQALRYTLIGSALRNELLGPDPAILRRRIAVALAGKAPLPATRPQARWQSPRYARALLGFGIAASVAVAAIVGMRMINDAQVAPSGAVAPLVARDVERVEPVPADRYVVPQEVSDAPVVAPQIRLTNYLVHHGEYASRLSRTSVHSNVVGASEPLPEALVEPSTPSIVSDPRRAPMPRTE